MSDSTFGAGDQISDRRIVWGIWFAAHHTLLTKIGYALLIVIVLMSWLFTFWGILQEYVLDGRDLRRAIAQMATATNERAVILARQRPEQIRIAEVLLVPSGAGTYDVAARVVNPNPQWLVTADYALTVPGAETVHEQTVLLPSQERWLTRLNVRSTAAPTQASLAFSRLAWHRIRHNEIHDVAGFTRDHLHIDVRDTRFQTPQELMVGGANGGAPGGGPISVSRATFTMENMSAYALRNLELVVLLYRGNALVGVNRIVLDEVPAGARRTDAATWFTPIGLVQRVVIAPYVNIFQEFSMFD